MTIIASNEKINENGLNKYNNNSSKITNGQTYPKANTGENEIIHVALEDKPNGFQTVDEDEVSCGWGPCKPRWLQFFATKQAFLVTFCFTWVCNLEKYHISTANNAWHSSNFNSAGSSRNVLHVLRLCDNDYREALPNPIENYGHHNVGYRNRSDWFIAIADLLWRSRSQA